MVGYSYSAKSCTLPLCPRLSTGRKRKTKHQPSGIAQCSDTWLYPQLVAKALIDQIPLSCTKGFSYPYKVIHKLWITFNFFSEKIFKFFQNIFPIQVHRIYNRKKSINLVLTRFIKDWFVSYSINFVSLFPIRIIKRQLLFSPRPIHRLWIIFF